MGRDSHSRHHSSRRRSRSRDKERKRSHSREKKHSRSRSRDKHRHRSRSDRHKYHERRNERDDKDKREQRPITSSSKPTEEEPKKKRRSLFDVRPSGVTDEVVGLDSDNALLLSMSIPTVQTGPQTRHARRLYVGGIGECSGKEVEAFFNQNIRKACNVELKQNPVINVFLCQDKRYAFVELNSVDITSQCLGMDGIMFNGQPLKVRRANDFNPAQLPPPDPKAPKLDLRKLGLTNIGPQVDEQTPKFIFSGFKSNSTTTSEKIFIELFKPFGKLLRLQIMRDAVTLRCRGYGYGEYEDNVICDLACSNLNGLDVGEFILNVEPANMDACQKMVPPDRAGDLDDLLKELTENYPIPKQPSRIMEIKNLISGEDLENNEKIIRIREDLNDECIRYGSVKSIEIPVDIKDKLNSGRIFVEFEFIEECKAAVTQLFGRKYDERIIFTAYFDEVRFLNRDFLY